jgi:transcriptional regulator with XRE-family HTH domain
MRRQSTVDRVAELCDWIRTGRARELREINGLTLNEIARDCEVSHVAVLRWEKGEWRPRGRNALTYHAVLRRLDARRAAREAA